jgi:hypothetical protein
MTAITSIILNPGEKPNESGGGPVVQWHYSDMQRTYGVQVNWQSAATEKSMYYDMLMHCKGVKDDIATWEISKSNIYLDNIRPEAPLELLAIACAEPCYPFEFDASKDGIIKSLLNTEKIKKRFAEAKEILFRDFDGGIALQYINATEQALNQLQQLKKIATTDLWLSLFFSPIIGQYNSEKIKPLSINLPFFGFQEPLVFNGAIRIDKPNFDNKSQALIVEAALDGTTIIEGEILLSGKLEATYDIDIPGHTIRNISCHATVITDKGEHHLWLNGYQIETKETPAPEKEDAKSKSWWSVF